MRVGRISLGLAVVLALVAVSSAAAQRTLDSREKSFFQALNKKDAKAAMRILKNGTMDPNLRDASGRTALMQASLAGLEEVVTELLDRGADVNAKSQEEQTALMLAADAGALEVVKLLLAKGADAKAKDRDEWTAVQYAKMRVTGTEGERKKVYEGIVTVLEEAAKPAGE